jgi:hypothetical protein
MEFLQASDETLHLVLETLQSAIKSGLSACLSIHFFRKRRHTMYWCLEFWAGNFLYDNVGGEQSTSIEPIISPIILDVWAQHIADPFISIDAIEVLEVCCRQNWIVPHHPPFPPQLIIHKFHICKNYLSFLFNMISNVHHETWKAIFMCCLKFECLAYTSVFDNHSVQNQELLNESALMCIWQWFTFFLPKYLMLLMGMLLNRKWLVSLQSILCYSTKVSCAPVIICYQIVVHFLLF